MHDLVIIPRYQWLPLKPQTQRFPSQRTQDITFDLRLLAAISASWTPRRVASLQVEQVYGPWEHRGISVGIDVPKIGDFGHHQNKSLLEIILYPQELGDVKKNGTFSKPWISWNIDKPWPFWNWTPTWADFFLPLPTALGDSSRSSNGCHHCRIYAGTALGRKNCVPILLLVDVYRDS